MNTVIRKFRTAGARALALALMCVSMTAATALAGDGTLPSDSVIRRAAARMLMVGFRGDSIDAANPVTGYLQDVGVDAIVLFDVDLTGSARLGSRNITSVPQLRHLTSDLRRLAGRPILIAADQEGGRVQRLKPAYGWERIPSAKEAAEGGTDAVSAQGALAAQQLADAGVNLNLAPVADLLIPGCPAISNLDRAYAASPDSVAEFCRSFIREHRTRGVISTIKHFPGHGSAVSDTHHGFTDVTATWTEKELVPFRSLIDSGDADAIMTAHIFNRDLDPDYPASLSQKITTGMLREAMGFDGLIITDDLYMEALRDNYPLDELMVLAINSGADLLCVGNNISTGFEADRPRLLVDIIVRAVKEGKIPYSRLADANRRLDAALARLK